MGRGGRSGGSSRGSSHSSGGSRGGSHSHSSGRSYSSGRSSYGGGGHSYYNSYHYSGHSHYGGGHYIGRTGYSMTGVIISFIFILVVCAMIRYSVNGVKMDSVPNSTIERVKIDTGKAYDNNNVIDEIGWLDSPSYVSKQLREFYELTGCQPYIILKEYSPFLETNAEVEAYSQKYYDEHFADDQHVVLYMYFCDYYDEGEGLSTLYYGTDSGMVFDAEAVDIFWSYLDYDWDNWDINDNDGMFIDVFNGTANKIMSISTTNKDLAKYGIFAIIAVTIGITIITVVKTKARRAKEKAAEDERILKQSINDLAKDNLEDKYL